jgi:DNA-directed RNA polymerase specialized sigma subunit
MDFGWVKNTTDRLFHSMTFRQRFILYLRYVEEKNWDEIGRALRLSAKRANAIYSEVMKYLRGHAKVLK